MIDAEVELKRTTADRLIAYRSRSGAGGLRALAARCRGVHADDPAPDVHAGAIPHQDVAGRVRRAGRNREGG